MFVCQSSEEITSIISRAWYFTTQCGESEICDKARPSAPGGPAWSSWASLLPIRGDRGLLLGSGSCVVRVAVEPEAVRICSTRRAGHAGPSAAAG
jgi:hypothetical protein